MLDEMMLGPARLVRNYLAKMTYLGPLREIPSRNYRPQVYRIKLDGRMVSRHGIFSTPTVQQS